MDYDAGDMAPLNMERDLVQRKVNVVKQIRLYGHTGGPTRSILHNIHDKDTFESLTPKGLVDPLS